MAKGLQRVNLQPDSGCLAAENEERKKTAQSCIRKATCLWGHSAGKSMPECTPPLAQGVYKGRPTPETLA
eukprot:scaffold45068_cov15-Tisochrysis_lutea.AAC.2